MLWRFFCFKQKTAYEMRISDWSSDVCSSDLPVAATYDCLFRIADAYRRATVGVRYDQLVALETDPADVAIVRQGLHFPRRDVDGLRHLRRMNAFVAVFDGPAAGQRVREARSEEHTSELQSLMRISYAVFCLQKKTTHETKNNNH